MAEFADWQWTADLCVHHETIDAQHRELIGYLTLLQESIGRHDIGTTVKLLDEFIDFTHMHFAGEEVLMRKSNYPQYLAHALKHESLLEEIRQLEKSIAAGRTPVSVALLDFLGVWLLEHIRTSDRQLGQFLSGVDAGAAGLD